MRNDRMTNKQAERVDILARLDELNRLEECTTDLATLEKIAERKKVLRTALESI